MKLTEQSRVSLTSLIANQGKNYVVSLIKTSLVILTIFISSCSKEELLTKEKFKGKMSTDQLLMSSQPLAKSIPDTIIVNDPFYFLKNTNNPAKVYIINVPIRLRSDLKINFSKTSIIKTGSSYPALNKHALFHIHHLKNFFLTGGIIEASDLKDAFLITGEVNNINISGVTIKKASKFGIEVYGGEKPSDYKPGYLNFTAIKTYDCRDGGIYIKNMHHVNIKYCNNYGGFRGIGLESTMPAHRDITLSHEERYANNINVFFCKSFNTSGFGIQLFYTDRVNISRSKMDASACNYGDKAAIAIDRATNTVMDRDTFINSVLHNVFITGATNTVLKNSYVNSKKTTKFLVDVFYNIEEDEDRVIKECHYTTIENNTLHGADIGIIVNGANYTTIKNNRIKYTGRYDTYIMDQKRSRDGVQMYSRNTVFAENLHQKKVYFLNEIAKHVSMFDNKLHF